MKHGKPDHWTPEDRGERFDQTEPPLLDVLASEARTALTPTPDYYDLNDQAAEQALAINKLDEIIETLNPTTNTREDFAKTLTMLGRHLAERQDEIEQSELTYEEHAPEDMRAYTDAHEALTRSLDALDEAINALTPEEGDDEDA